MLGIIGYNYTDRYIDNFTIDGQGGGYIRLSSPTSGGSSTVCCVLLSKKPTWPMRVRVRWSVGGCREYEKYRRYGHIHNFYKETEVEVDHELKVLPSDIAAHFFADGSVKVRLSDGWEPPLVKLSKDRPDKENYPECEVGQENTERSKLFDLITGELKHGWKNNTLVDRTMTASDVET